MWRKLTGLRSSRFGMFCWRGHWEQSHQAGKGKKNTKGGSQAKNSPARIARQASKRWVCVARPRFHAGRLTSRRLRSRKLTNKLEQKREPRINPGREEEREIGTGSQTELTGVVGCFFEVGCCWRRSRRRSGGACGVVVSNWASTVTRRDGTREAGEGDVRATARMLVVEAPGNWSLPRAVGGSTDGLVGIESHTGGEHTCRGGWVVE